jgi:dihydrofolate reductase
MKNHPPILSAIVAMASNRAIGRDNKLPWHLPADLKHFKEITTGNPILMGRKTYESIGRPLPNRTNIIMTRDGSYSAKGCFVVTSIEAALQLAAEENKSEIFVIGGAEIYKQLLPRIQRIYLTVIHDDIEGDTFFPALDSAEWREVAREDFMANADNGFDYSFLILER